MDSDDAFGKIVTGSAAVLGALVTSTTALASATGGLQRTFRDHPVLTVIALFLAAAAAVVGIGLASRSMGSDDQSRHYRQRCYAWATVLLVSSLFFGGLAAVLAARSQQSPAITGTLDTAANRLDLKLTAQGIASSDEVSVRVQGHFPPEIEDEIRSSRNLSPDLIVADLLLFAQVTPDADGSIERTFAIPLAHRAYTYVTGQAWIGKGPWNCGFEDKNNRRTSSAPSASPRASSPPLSTNTSPGTLGPGCLLVSLPTAGGPTLKAEWDTSHAEPILVATTDLTDAPPDKILALVVRDANNAELFNGSMLPTNDGSAHIKAAVPIAEHSKFPICIAASTAVHDAKCGASQASASWMRVSGPPPSSRK